MDSLHATFVRIVTKGIERHELRPGLDADSCATLFIALLEGAVMLSQLYQDPLHVRRAAAYLTRHIETNMRNESPFSDQQSE
jgi:hypothetical protein